MNEIARVIVSTNPDLLGGFQSPPLDAYPVVTAPLPFPFEAYPFPFPEAVKEPDMRSHFLVPRLATKRMKLTFSFVRLSLSFVGIPFSFVRISLSFVGHSFSFFAHFGRMSLSFTLSFVRVSLSFPFSFSLVWYKSLPLACK